MWGNMGGKHYLDVYGAGQSKIHATKLSSLGNAALSPVCYEFI